MCQMGPKWPLHKGRLSSSTYMFSLAATLTNILKVHSKVLIKRILLAQGVAGVLISYGQIWLLHRKGGPKKTEMNHGMGRHPKGENCATRVKILDTLCYMGVDQVLSEPEKKTSISVLDVWEGFTGKLTLNLSLEGEVGFFQAQEKVKDILGKGNINKILWRIGFHVEVNGRN